METTSIEAALVTSARAGDRQAMETLLTGYLPLVYRVAGRALAGHPDVDDVVQETILRAIQGLPGLREPDHFRSWLVAITHRQLYDRSRARSATLARYRPLDAAAERDHPVADIAECAIRQLELSGTQRTTVEASQLLSPADQGVLALWWREVAGALTRAQLATELGLNQRHTAVRVHRARARLAQAHAVLRAWQADPRCRRLSAAAGGVTDHHDPRWLRRLGRHLRDCDRCATGTA